MPDLPFGGSGRPNVAARPLPEKRKKDVHKAREGMKVDLARFRRIKRLHRHLCVLNRTDDDYATAEPPDDLPESDGEYGLATPPKQSSDAVQIDGPTKELSSPTGLDTLDAAQDAPSNALSRLAAQSVISTFCGVMLEHVGFDCEREFPAALDVKQD